MKEREFFGSYQLLHGIGSGGAAEVFRARHIHPAYEQSFAIKILHKEQRRRTEVTKGFRREAYVLAMLRHANIVQTIEAGIEGGDMFIAMEFVDGKDLRDVLERLNSQPLAQPVALHIVAEILRGLAYGHELEDDGQALNIIHRDLKPSNILLGFDGSVKITDFGIVTLTDAAALGPPDRVMGTLGYIAPEALVGDVVDQRADIFAVGSILYELLTGLGPFEDVNTEVLLRNNTRAKMPHPQKINPRLSDGLSDVLLKALERKPAKRHQNAWELLADLDPFLPKTKGIGLAVSTYLRSLFVDDFVKRMRYATDKPKAPKRIALLVSDRLYAVLEEGTAAHGVTLNRYPDSSSFGAALVQSDNAAENRPDVLIIDVSHENYAFDLIRAARAQTRHKIPVITACDSLLPSYVAQSYELGAVDVVYGPPQAARLLASIRNAMVTRQVSAVKSSTGTHRVGIVTEDQTLIARLQPSLEKSGCIVSILKNGAAAVSQCAEQTFHAFIVDGHATFDGPGVFVDTVRAQTGYGVLPVLCLLEHMEPVKLPNRCTTRLRGDSVDVITAALNEVRNAHHFGRLFTRVSCDFRVGLRYQGRTLETHCSNMSRGGMLLETSHLPSKGVQVMLSFRLKDHSLEIQGQVVRAEPPREDEGKDTSYVSIAFMPANATTERAVIAYLADHVPEKP